MNLFADFFRFLKCLFIKNSRKTPQKWTIYEDFKDCIHALAEQKCTVKTSDRSLKNPKRFLNNTAMSVQLPYIAGHSLLQRFLNL